MQVLSRQDGLTPALVPHVIPLLAWDPVADHAMFALRKVAEEHVGQLVDALSIRTRISRCAAGWRACSRCASRSARPTALMLGLDDARFDVRFQSARSLAAIAREEPARRDRRAHASSTSC